MFNSPLNVVVIDDDFMIARMHGKFIDTQENYQLAGLAHNYEQALYTVMELQPDLLLLDVYLPDQSGLELLRTIRNRNIPCDVILITASKEHDIVEEALRLGIFDYLMKPFDMDHLRHTLVKYTQFKTRLSSTTQMDQQFLNELMKLRSPKTSLNQLQKGIDERTLERIKQCLDAQNSYQSADEIAHLAGVSLTTVRNYLTFLIKENAVEELLQYGTIGRPQRLYRLNK